MDVTDITEDGFLDGRVRVRQFARGFRSGLDAVMLAAAVPAKHGERVLDLGSGSGVASLCVAARVPDCTVTGIERDRDHASLAKANAAANEMEQRVRFAQGDVLNLPGEFRTAFDHVLCNPPFHGDAGQTSPDTTRAQALQDFGDLPRWLGAGMKRTASNGTFTIVLRADRLNEALHTLPKYGVSAFPLWPKADAPAKRVILQLQRGSRAPFMLFSGLVLHQADGRYTPEADAVLRGRRALVIGESRR